MDIIVKNKLKLIKWLQVDPTIILQHVQTHGLITNSEYGKLKSISRNKSKENVAIDLLDIICEKGENVCQEFLKMLKDDDVNEISPELSAWIKTVEIKETIPAGPSNHQQNLRPSSGVCASLTASDGSTVFAPIIMNSKSGPININMNAPSGKPDLVRNSDQTKDCGRGKSKVVTDFKEFLKDNTSSLVQNVKHIEVILDDLDLHPEAAANVRSKGTDQAKMRELLGYINSKAIAKRLVKALFKHERDLMDDLLS
ncbi:uncharacterized protein [Misgurnus anguillicaudatus]|uniref:uncharacterized protein isoform X2 n=1 Tax=Misgurnus anguillicaudatus TaxID=75329 RepID=UPI003CCFC97D